MNNYFKIINRFFDEAPDLDGYKTDHPALFYAIVDSINRNGWRDTEIEYDRIINKVKLGKKNYLAARDWLKTNRFIRFIPGRGDYQKAKFGLGDAVLGKTASDTADNGGAVPPDTAPDTAGSTSPGTADNGSAVLPNTADDTAPDTAPGTAADTHLIGRHITDYILPTNQQQHQQGDSPDSESDVGGDDVENDGSAFQKKIGLPQNTPPQPPPKPDKVPINGSEFRDAIRLNRLAFEHAHRLKLVADESAFHELIEAFLSYQAVRQEAENPAINSVDDLIFTCLADAKKHFVNWMNTRDVHAPTANKSTNGSQRTNQRGKGTLRPTSLGQVDYRGEGSTCNVEL